MPPTGNCQKRCIQGHGKDKQFHKTPRRETSIKEHMPTNFRSQIEHTQIIQRYQHTRGN